MRRCWARSRRATTNRSDILGWVLLLGCLLNRSPSQRDVAAFGFQELADETTGPLAQNFTTSQEIFALMDRRIERRRASGRLFLCLNYITLPYILFL